MVLWLRPTLDGERDGCRCRDCGWVKELANCFPELHRCVWGSLCDVPVLINTVADVVGCECCNHEGEDKSRAEGFGAEPCCKHGSTFRLVQKASMCFAGLLSFSPLYNS